MDLKWYFFSSAGKKDCKIADVCYSNFFCSIFFSWFKRNILVINELAPAPARMRKKPSNKKADTSVTLKRNNSPPSFMVTKIKIMW